VDLGDQLRPSLMSHVSQPSPVPRVKKNVKSSGQNHVATKPLELQGLNLRRDDISGSYPSAGSRAPFGNRPDMMTGAAAQVGLSLSERAEHHFRRGAPRARRTGTPSRPRAASRVIVHAKREGVTSSAVTQSYGWKDGTKPRRSAVLAMEAGSRRVSCGVYCVAGVLQQ
jgi:hypothetical protein